MALVDYSLLIQGIVKPLVTHPESILVEEVHENDSILLKVKVDEDDLGRVIGKKGRVASAIRTLVHAAASRNKATVDVEFVSLND